MENIKFFKHTADVKYEASGKTLEEAFQNAAEVIYTILTENKVKPIIKKQIKIESKNKRSLLYDFLEEIIALMDTDNLLISKAKVKIKNKNNQYELEAELEGDYFKNYECHGAIKSMTYSDIKIEEKENETTVTVVLDI